MPKKQPRNAFYFFMMDFKEEQRKKGNRYANMAEVSQAAGPLWSAAAPEVRTKFEAMAKAEKAKLNVPENKFTSTGVSLAELEANERRLQEAAEVERRDIINFVKQKSVNKSILDEDIFLMDVNCYCLARGSWLVGEFSLLRFNLRHGIKDSYHELINPGGIPMGFAVDVKQGSKELGLPMPDEAEQHTDYIDVLAKVMDYLRRSDDPVYANRRADPLPPVYSLPQKVMQCADFLDQLCRAARYDMMFRVYKLNTLFYELVKHDERFPKEDLALTHLKKNPFKYTPDLACKTHVEVDKCVECTQSRVTSWAFTVLDNTCAVFGLPAQPGRHVPADYDLPAIQAYKEKHRVYLQEAQGPVTAPDDSAHLSALDTSRNTSTEKKRSHAPLRMPKTDYSMQLRATPPELSERESAPLGAARAPLCVSATACGRGRGLAMAALFERMKMKPG